MCALEKERREEKNEEIKRGKCPEPRKKEEVREEVKMDKCPTVELGVEDTHLRGKKMKNRASHSPRKIFQRARKVCIPSKGKRIRLSPLFSPLSPYTIHSQHMHILI